MGRSARATPEALARACKKLQADDNLTIHTLRHELGGGGAEYLTRGLRAWRQQQREEARGPVEQMVSAALKTALTDDLQRVRDEAMQEVHASYVEDRAHLNFCLAESRRFEEEVDKAAAKMAAIEAASARIRIQAEASVKEASDRVRTQEQRADELATQLSDLQEARRDKCGEYAAVRRQREEAVQEVGRERAAHLQTRQQRDVLAETGAAETTERVKLEERCVQQQEMLRYIRADLEAKAGDLKEAYVQNAQLQQELKASDQTAARAQAKLEARRHDPRARLLLSPPYQARLSMAKSPSV